MNKNHPKTFVGALKSLHSAKQTKRSMKLGVEAISIFKETLLYFLLTSKARSSPIN